MTATLSPAALALLVEYEGVDQPALWPGGESGVTIGYGYDLAHERRFRLDWQGLLPEVQMDRLASAIGLSGEAAKAKARQFKDIHIRELDARKVLISRTIPQEIATTLTAFPGADRLPADCLGALVSLVFNRGTGMTGDRRTEMRLIRDAVKADRPTAVPALLRAMSRVWVGSDIERGMKRRREAEAALWEKGLRA